MQGSEKVKKTGENRNDGLVILRMFLDLSGLQCPFPFTGLFRFANANDPES